MDCFGACRGSQTPQSPSLPHQNGSEGVAFSQVGRPRHSSCDAFSWLNSPAHACRSPTLRLPPRDDRRMVHGESGWLTSLPAGTFTRQHSTSLPGAPHSASVAITERALRLAPPGSRRHLPPAIQGIPVSTGITALSPMAFPCLCLNNTKIDPIRHPVATVFPTTSRPSIVSIFYSKQ